jgi:hypothetical protein
MNKLPVSIEVLVGLATAPVLLALIGGRAVALAMQELGEASEELFRGDRLPVLRSPIVPHSESTTDSVE